MSELISCILTIDGPSSQGTVFFDVPLFERDTQWSHFIDVSERESFDEEMMT